MAKMNDERLAELKSTASWIDDVRELLAEIERLRVRLAAAEKVCEAADDVILSSDKDPEYEGLYHVGKDWLDLLSSFIKAWQSLKDASDA